MQMMGPDCHSDEGRVGSLILKATPEFLTQVIMVSSLGIRFFYLFLFFFNQLYSKDLGFTSLASAQMDACRRRALLLVPASLAPK